jgi:hypothetical protein
MKIGIMQPYFLPYIGYFQLIDSVDVYVNLDHVSFMKRSYMVRNFLKNENTINLNVYNGSQNRKCSEVIVNFDNEYVPKFKKKLHHLYSKSINYDIIIEQIINRNFVDNNQSVASFNFALLKSICEFLEIKTKLIDTSEGLTQNKKADGLIDIIKYFGANTYVNAIGGVKLYDKEYFKSKSVDLFFINMEKTIFDNPYSSILDLLFQYDKNLIKQEIKKYTLI